MRRLPLLLLLALVVLLPGTASGAGRERPNLVVVMTDDQTLADLDAMPQTRSLVGDAGATFTNAYVSYPLCCPSRATFLTGRYAHNHGVRTNAPPQGGVEALDAERTLPVWLQAAGYDTSHVGKYLNGYGLRREATVPPGWSDWHATVDKSTYQMWGYRMFENGETTTYGSFGDEDPALYQTDVLRDKALDVVRAHAAPDADPYLLSLALVAPHGEVVPPLTTTQPYLRPAPRHRGRFATLPLLSGAYDELDVADKPGHIRRLRRIGPRTRLRIERDFRARRESLLAVDEAVAAIVGELERTGQLDSTYVVVTSDNGFLQGEHRVAKGKYLPYEPSTHVPLLVRGPGIAPGTVSDELVANVDLAPTLLDAAGASSGGEPLDGRSLLPFAREGERRSDRPVLHEGLVAGDVDRDGIDARAGATGRDRAGVYYAIRTRRYLYVKWRGGERELYDRLLDPDELTSVHADPRYAAIRRALSAEVSRLRACAGPDCRIPFSEPVLRRTRPSRQVAGVRQRTVRSSPSTRADKLRP